MDPTTIDSSDSRPWWIQGPSDEHALSLGYYFDEPSAVRVREFFRRFLRHGKGRWAGQPFELLEWQWAYHIAPIFGWRAPDGKRRFTQAYWEVPKKNGKSTMGAGIALYLAMADNEPGAEVYIAAADRNQASIIFREVDSMVAQSPALARRLLIRRASKVCRYPARNSFIQTLSADAPTKEGLNIHGLIFDELHAQRTRDLWDTLRYGGAAREQPLTVAITTAGTDRESICFEMHQRAKRVIAGEELDPSFHAKIWAAEPGDDWRSPPTWRKANPSLGHTMTEKRFAEEVAEAASNPRAENAFKRYRLNIWTETAVRWLNMESWDACPKDMDAASLEGEFCYGGLDLASTQDLNAFTLYFPKPRAVLAWYWVPEAMVSARERLNKQRIGDWVRRGFITRTSGDKVDRERIGADILKICPRYKVDSIRFDRWGACELTTRLQSEGLKLYDFAQTFGAMNAPCKELEILVTGKSLTHFANPVLRWNAVNTCIVQNDAEQMKISKKRSAEKIDGIAALIMSLGGVVAEKVKKQSVYEKRDVRAVGGADVRGPANNVGANPADA